MDELVKRLREEASEWCSNCCYRCGVNVCGAPDDRKNDCDIASKLQAADAIEQLIEERDAYRKAMTDEHNRAAKLAWEKEHCWIPVTERLPVGGDDSGAICENVCLLMDDGTVSCGWMNGITKKAYYLNARDDVVIKAPITRVTHWMPLPPAPKEE